MSDIPESIPKHERRYCKLNLPHSWHAPIKYMPDSVLVEINWHEKRWYTDCPMPKDIPFIGPQKYVHDDKYQVLQAENKWLRKALEEIAGYYKSCENSEQDFSLSHDDMIEVARKALYVLKKGQ